MSKTKKRFGDRKDGTLIRDLDPMHFIVPLIAPDRCENEAYISERIDLTAVNNWLAEKNKTETKYPYKLFNVIVVAMLKTVMLRPKLNRFIANKNIYQRNCLSASFVVKKQFKDDAHEALAFIYAEEGDTIATLNEKIRHIIQDCRSEQLDSTTDVMDIFNKMPRFLSKAIVRFVRVLDKHGLVPKSLIETDSHYATVFLSNLGSIKLKSGYHHLTNWGTNSFFVVVGEKKLFPYYDAEGNIEMREAVELGLTLDERIADGYYYTKSIQLFKKLMEHPELLELPLNTEVDY